MKYEKDGKTIEITNVLRFLVCKDDWNLHLSLLYFYLNFILFF